MVMGLYFVASQHTVIVGFYHLAWVSRSQYCLWFFDFITCHGFRSLLRAVIAGISVAAAVVFYLDGAGGDWLPGLLSGPPVCAKTLGDSAKLQWSRGDCTTGCFTHHSSGGQRGGICSA